jgi:hypothetical protein
MELAVSIGLGGWVLLVVGAVLVGFVTQLIGEATLDYEWVATSIGAFVGAIVASEFVVGWRTFGFIADGVAVVPALVGGVIVAGLVAIVARMTVREPGHRATAA